MFPTTFAQIIGNEPIKKQLARMIAKRAIGHALCFAGPEGIGKSLFAWALSAQLMEQMDPGKNHPLKIQKGQHPDIHVYRPEGKLGLHSIQSMKEFSDEVYLPPFEASWKTFIIHDADRMLSTSANALLKTFEEPPPRTLIILLSRSKASLIPTILSRCSTLHFQSLSKEEIDAFLKTRTQLNEEERIKIASLAQGSAARAGRLAEGGGELRLQLLDLLARSPLGNYRQLKEGVQEINAQIEAAKKQAEEAIELQTDQMTASQRNALEKELEGFVATAQAQEATSLFETLLSWFRDLQVLFLGGSRDHLTNPDYFEDLEQIVQRGKFNGLGEIQQAVDEAYLSLKRSTSLTVCLETLFLKLGVV